MVVVDVYALPTGKLYLPDRWLFEDGSENQLQDRQFSPDFSFLIVHPSGKKILFDLGLRKVCASYIELTDNQELDNNPQVIQNDYACIDPQVPKDAVDLLNAGHIKAASIDAIILSHLHFDHTGDVTKFPDSEIIAGPGSRAATYPGWPVEPLSPFLSSVLEHPKFRELDFEKSTEIGPFPQAIDYFGDQSLYIISTPGHMPGHLGALARTGTSEYVFIGGDCCHHRALLVGSRAMSITVGPNGTKSFHKDPDAAKQTILKVRELEKEMNVLVALAHDALLEGRLPVYPQKVNGWQTSEWKKDLDRVIKELYTTTVPL